MADRLLNEAGVAVLPGTAFGEGGKGYVRLAYTQSEENLAEALNRIERFMAAG
jgi:aspartate/methionine/tyrosine aminotransferase